MPVGASRIGVSVPTLIRMERGGPGVSMGIYITALWLPGLAGRLSELASPAHDLRAVEISVRAATRKRSTP